MKIKIISNENDVTYTQRSVVIETDDYDNLKNLSFDEISQLIEDREVELNDERLEDFVLDNGKVFNEDGYSNTELLIEDEEERLVTSWYKNGQKEEEGYNKKGKKEGLQTSWYKNGQKRSEINYKNGKKEGLEIHWYKNGQKMFERNWKNGEMEGIWNLWYENGQKQIEINYKNGEIEGLHISWYENGQKMSEQKWKNGKLID